MELIVTKTPSHWVEGPTGPVVGTVPVEECEDFPGFGVTRAGPNGRGHCKSHSKNRNEHRAFSKVASPPVSLGQ